LSLLAQEGQWQGSKHSEAIQRAFHDFVKYCLARSLRRGDQRHGKL
jgi:hypothetical protein